jgi:hypothetical protein
METVFNSFCQRDTIAQEQGAIVKDELAVLQQRAIVGLSAETRIIYDTL